MPAATSTVQLSAPLIVPAGTFFDGGNKRYNLSGGGQDEGQPPVIQVENGATVRNVIIGPLASDGIHCMGSCTLENVWWEDVGEDAATGKGPAGSVMTINCGAAYNAADKVFQHNGRGEVRISNFYAQADGVSKLYRSCGDCTGNGGPRKVFINNVATRNVGTTTGVNYNYGDVATIRNMVLDNISDQRNKMCQVFIGKDKTEGTSETIGVFWNTTACNVSHSDVWLLGISRYSLGECNIGDCSAYNN